MPRRLHQKTRTHSALLVAGLMLGIVACSADDNPVEAAQVDGVFDARPVEHFGLVVLTLTEEHGTPRLEARLTGNAWFVEHDMGQRGRVVDLLEPLVEGADSLTREPMEGVSSATLSDRCMLTEKRLGSRNSSGTGPVYFMDAGELSLESDSGALLFQSTYFPDVDPDIGGLVYDADERNARVMLTSPTVRVTGSGAAEVGAFSAELNPPAPLRLTGVGSARLAPGLRPAYLAAPQREDVLVTWLSARNAGSGDDLVSVRYVRQGFDRVATVTCRVPDTGRFTMPAEALAALPDMGEDQTDRLDVARISATTFEAEGLTTATAVIIARDTIQLR